MTTLSWKLSVTPTTTPDYWVLFVDGALWILAEFAPYTGPGAYSVDLAQLSAAVPPLPTDGAAHNYSVALSGQGVIGPLSAPVSITLSPGVKPPAQPPPVWPVADSVLST